MDTEAMEVCAIPVAAIRVGTRRRPVDEKVVREIAASIEQQGLFQPIGIKSIDDTASEEENTLWEVVFGAHRLAAYSLLKYPAIAARIVPDGLTEDEYLLIELQENRIRKDLTQGERKAYTAEIETLHSKIEKNSGVSTQNKKWLIDLGKDTGIPQSTLYMWWNSFCKDTQRHSLKPADALQEDREAFSTWLRQQQEAEAAEKTRKEEEALAQRRAQDMADALENLEQLATDYGRQAVVQEVVNVFLAEES